MGILCILFVLVYLSRYCGGVRINFQSSNKVPIQGNSLQLSCLVNTTSDDGKYDTTWSSPTIVNLGKCYREVKVCSGGSMTRQLTADENGSYLNIRVLNRSLDEGYWKCVYVGQGQVQAELFVTVYIPVSTVQLMNGSGQTLSSSANIVRGQSTIIRCSTAPKGSRPRALFQWYIRQGNQSAVLIEGQSISPTPDTESVSDLLISYSTWNLTGNASYHDMYIFCQAQDEANTGNYTKSEEVRLNIVYPPVVHLSTYQSTYNVTEGVQNFVFNCNIIEANPLPQANGYSWFHKTSIIQGQTSSSYTLPSVLRSDAGEYWCTARNDYGAGTSNSLDLIVQHPPNISVILTGSTQQNQTATLMCGAIGVPAETTFYPWVQMWGDVVIRTGLQGQTNSTHSVLTLDRLSLESMGTYVCTASNGIMGINGTLNQTGSESLHVKGAASILTKNAGFVGEISLSANMSISFYCDPPIRRFVIWNNSKEIMNTSRTITSLSNDIVNYIVHNKTIQLNAQKAHFVILNVTVEDFDNYNLVLTNSIDSTSFLFHLDAFGPPLMVQRFYFNRFVDDQIELHFDAGFNGGPEQTFVIEYISDTSFDNGWKNVSTSEIMEKESQFRLLNGTFFIEFSAPPPGHYIYRMYSWNVKGRSPFSDNITVTIPDKNNAQKRIFTVEAVAGGVGAAVVVLVSISVGLILLRRRSLLQKKSIAQNINSERINRKRPESGLVGNPVYDSSGPTHDMASGTTTTEDKHALVIKPKKNDGLSNLYAQVDKTNKDGRKGDVYENTNLALKSSAENVYENPGQLAATPNSSENAYENPETVSKGQLVNKCGLLYADVILGPPTKKAGKPVIHGLDNRTEYAEIDYGKRGTPLPETDVEKERGGAKQKNVAKMNTDE